ncbi:D-alanyl-D-alanine carboxypeptidase [Streptomyces ipomoeae]|uniref:D-alanyl-D-alanine carboxypeptidase n=1 Tax=Streptomyces ipomoeae TaxID=103232 RepID=A0AAE8VYW9_9ACTN|nr:D-alanyl-D-alanine carboxypeptidase [Streptomyces ipomoeae]TQE27504.1 D-alanyl-D-alanine carboxypeptidase [Streptomyces ipomoeae]TQE37287.1 D-alanyl-D-alanine carboxypeptidase [Streptomyces ipomoeae]
MAGTSPGRSKRYESSTGSTTGDERDEPAVPNPTTPETSDPAPTQPTGSARPPADPRVSLSRDTTPKADQATAVFSRRALLEAAKAEGVRLEEAETGAAKTDEAEDAEETGAAKAGRSETAGSGDGEVRDEDDDTEPESDEGEDAEPGSDEGEDAGVDGGEADGTEPEADAEAEGDDAHPRDRGAAAPTRGASAARLPAATTGENTAPDAEPGSGDGPEAEVGDDSAADSTGGVKSGFGGDVKSGPSRGSEAEADGDEVSGRGSGSGSGSVGDAEAGATGDAGPGSGDGLAAEVGDDSTGGAKSGVSGGAKSGPSGGSEAEVVEDAKPGFGEDSADGEPEAVDGEDAPAGPPADGDESRTGGAGGKSDGDGGAEAGRPVDQATAIFRAPRLPAVDQPTTMLKLGGAIKPASDTAKGDNRSGEDAKGAPNAGDSDGGAQDSAVPPAERTSKFVALKPLDEPSRPKASAAAPEAPGLSPAEATRALPHVGPERTTQQPLPPKPPLDLLAELTNTPPPPQTPLRTAIRRVKIWTPLAILLVIIFAVVQTLRPLPTPTLALTAEESYAFKGDKVSLPWPEEGQGWMDVNGIGTMDSFGEQKPVAIGSVAKAMTAYVILKDHPMKPGAKGETIQVDAKAETEGGYDKDGESTLNTVKEGDKLTQYDAIAAIMIPSANNIARLLARWDSNGSEEAFVKKMNDAAKDLGMKNTTYTDPSGLKETTVSTAEDQVKLGNELVKMKALTDITKLPYWHDPSGQRWDNYNRLVPFNNAIGIKTGSTTAAGGNLLFAGTQEVGGETAIVVGAILGQHTPPIIDTVNAVSKTAMLAAQDALTSDTILKKGDVVGYVDDQLGGRTPVMVTKDVSAVGWAGKTVRLELDASDSLPHEAESGTRVGSLIVGDGSGEGVEVPVALQQDLTEPGFGAKVTRVS